MLLVEILPFLSRKGTLIKGLVMDYKALANILYTPVEYFLDWVRQLRWSKASPLCSDELQVSYDIILLAHTVEKGLSVSHPRPGFGYEKISKLLGYLDAYKQGWWEFPLSKSYGCLLEYMDWHTSIGHELGDFGDRISAKLAELDGAGVVPLGGTKRIDNSSLSMDESFESSLLSRFSCRRFEDKVVDQDILLRIADVAVRAPSQCNRQSVRIHCYNSPEKVDRLLRLQGGAEGFRSSVKNLFVITSEISAWSGAKARSQAYVDGALVAMQVLNACQALGLGACPLNLAVLNSTESKIIDAGDIPPGERLVVMIAFGYPEKVELKVARSERISAHKIMTVH